MRSCLVNLGRLARPQIRPAQRIDRPQKVRDQTNRDGNADRPIPAKVYGSGATAERVKSSLVIHMSVVGLGLPKRNDRAKQRLQVVPVSVGRFER